MGKVELYKSAPHGWDINRNYLIFKKIKGRYSSGLITERYEVTKRWSAQGYGEKGIFTNSLKGVEYTKNELQNIVKL